ncbi:hypothetical protein JJQ72_13555 [Paenibacillus sp. F411]|uniref:Uncharacterized protein n=1 Tax=Paenibacillus algicola TaxID=2565926 RepID=A0A4P8XJF9_9BACL|nr:MULTISPECIES: hypothetical protein [Paenibacillus]MBO2944998.1 hypothetical protein [Paenibacillus sp. F411]QCT02393.1 hypothetical protein E6C60_1678 [Paenibacillus algicola]
MKQSPLQTQEELLLVKESAVLPVLLDVLERDLAGMEGSGLTKLYVQRVKEIQSSIMTRLSLLKHESRSRSIAIIHTRRREHSLHVSYLCRGYRHQMELQWDFVKADLERRLAGVLLINLEEDSREPVHNTPAAERLNKPT